MRKNLDISEEAVIALTIEAVKQVPKSDFKNFAQKILEDYAKPFMVLKKPYSVGSNSFHRT